MASVYIIKSIKTGKYYIGSTKDFAKRFNEHQKGFVRSTKCLRPFEIKLIQQYSSITKAKEAEYKIKKLKRKDYIEKMIKDGFIKIK